MSKYSAWYTCTIANGGTKSTTVEFDVEYEYVMVVLPDLDSGTLNLEVSKDNVTFQDLGSGVTTSTTTGAYSTVMILGGWQFVKIESSATQTADRTISMRGMRS